MDTIHKQVAAIILQNFGKLHQLFSMEGKMAKERFIEKEWLEQRQAVVKRMEMPEFYKNLTVQQINSNFSQILSSKGEWAKVIAAYIEFTKPLADINPARAFFLNVTKTIFREESTQFQLPPFEEKTKKTLVLSEERCNSGNATERVVRLLQVINFPKEKIDYTQEAHFIASKIAENIDGEDNLCIELFPQPFFRNTHAYVIGKIKTNFKQIPFAVPLVNTMHGIRADAVLFGEESLKKIFEFTRSYFLIDTADPDLLVNYLMELMPSKQKEQLYINVGYSEYGKYLFLNAFERYLYETNEHLDSSPGTKGMVMIVFELPGFNSVFKIIRDNAKPPKETSKELVMEKYQFVAFHDRVGRLADTQLINYLRIPKDRFAPLLLDELLLESKESVTVEGDWIILDNLYMERKMIPLNLFLQQFSERGSEIIEEYGRAIKELAQANIFPGDLLTKNFGVTPEGRVVFYDYDEVSLLTEVNFRKLPVASDHYEEMSHDPWFHVGPFDVFPEEFIKFLIPEGPLRNYFLKDHKDLLDIYYWKEWQCLHLEGKVVDIHPYESQRMQLPI